MTPLKSERHHWWPETVSKYWRNADGFTHWLHPDGEVKLMPPKNLGVITNGHHVKFGQPGEETVWDHSFENEFYKADDKFSGVIEWLASLEKDRHRYDEEDPRFAAHVAPEDRLSDLTEGIVSLAIRSPRYREAAVALADELRGPVPLAERRALIGSNMAQRQREVVRHIGNSGKFILIFSPEREFIFGDGFYHDVHPVMSSLSASKIVAPLTPNMTVLYIRSASWETEPRLMSYVVSPDEAEGFNLAVQVYAKGALFYRDQRPEIHGAFRLATHCRFENSFNPVDDFIEQIPGIEKRDREMEAWLEEVSKQACSEILATQE